AAPPRSLAPDCLLVGGRPAASAGQCTAPAAARAASPPRRPPAPTATRSTADEPGRLHPRLWGARAPRGGAVRDGVGQPPRRRAALRRARVREPGAARDVHLAQRRAPRRTAPAPAPVSHADDRNRRGRPRRLAGVDGDGLARADLHAALDAAGG